ncbi:MAG: class I SAM-dependent methyltransferase [Oligoflexia bacterium]|nr:class I SAM-dependent methyltransferase [Oligoflexia bacterium]
MTYYNQLAVQTNSLTIKRKKEYISYNFGKLIDKMLEDEGCHILEIGPGMGEFLDYCNGKKAFDIDIIDRDKGITEYLENTYKLASSFTSLNDFFNGKRGFYDIIMMTQVLEHIPVAEHISIIQKLYERLSKGGVMIVTVPNIGNPLAIYERYYDYTHETAFTEHSLEQMIDFAQLKNSSIQVQPFQIPPTSFINVIRRVIQEILHFFFKLLFMVNGGVYPRILTTNISLIIEKTA